MASTPWLTLVLIYTLLFNAFGLPLQKASNRADANKRGHTAKAENDQVISEDPLIKQIKDPSFAPRYPPCARYGCGKREMYMGKERTPYSYLASKIRQLQRKRAVGIDPPCARYACGKRK